MAKHIKLDKEILRSFDILNTRRSALLDILSSVGEANKELWDKLKLTYPDYDFTGAFIENESKELIIPFEKKVNKKK